MPLLLFTPLGSPPAASPVSELPTVHTWPQGRCASEGCLSLCAFCVGSAEGGSSLRRPVCLDPKLVAKNVCPLFPRF